MSNYALIIRLREQALAKLKESTVLFEQAYEILAEGKPKEAKKLRDAARSRRADSAWLMREANRLEENSGPPTKPK